MIRESSVPPGLVESPDGPVEDVRIWTADLSTLSASDRTELYDSLDAAERARAARFHFERDRNQYVATRGFLRRLLGDALGKPPSDVPIVYGAHGKPALGETGRQTPPLEFNLSHSATYAIFALAWNREVGIDLESADRLERDGTGISALAARVLSPRELTVWQTLPDTKRRAAFLRAWTRKEAYLKATGQGLFDGLQSIELALDAVAPKPSLTICAPALRGQRGCDWLIHDLAAPMGFAAAIALGPRRA